jgi:uncharacterized protein YndB with AHSA1/START domain
MEARDGSEGFDFIGTYTRVEPNKVIEYELEDGREVQIEFQEEPGFVVVRETFDAEDENPTDLQRAGWQAILDRFAQHVTAGQGGPDRPS